VEEQRYPIPLRPIRLALPPGETMPVLADADRIRQVVINYVTNALKFAPPDRPIEVGARREGGQARVWVRDEGPGVGQDDQERIWERGYQVGVAQHSGSRIGLGLGLYISRSLIEGHWGQVGVESVPGQGATFWFTLPLADDAP
jgi:signal transduction histidine kinase